MSRGKRYNGEPKLNLKKVFGVIATIVIIIAIIVGINKILKADKNTIASKNVELNYYTLFSNGNWGVINSSGDKVIEPAYGEMIVIPNKAKPIFICTYEVNYVDGTYKTKAINEKNEQIFTGYDNIMAIQNFDLNNHLWFEENALKVQKNGKFGLINIDGKEILPCEYDSITILKGIQNSLIAKKDSKVGIVNSDGTLIVPVEYTEVESVTQDYKDGFIVKNASSKYGVIKADGKTALECKYDAIENMVDNDKYLVKENGAWKIVAEDGTAYLDGKVGNVSSMNNGNVVVSQNGKYGVINIASEIKIPSEYDALTYVFDDNYIAQKDGKFGVVNTKNETVVDFKYADIQYNKSTDYLKAKNDNGTYDYITRNLSVKMTAGDESIFDNFITIKQGADVKYYNYKLEEKSNKDVYPNNTLFVYKENGKYGYKNKDGKVVVEATYDDATEQNACGYEAVKKDGKWGALDQYGNVVVEPTYMLDSSKTIDFIGKWHACADMNANYYTDAE